jgi:predicted nuclease with TOPRIM domain
MDNVNLNIDDLIFEIGKKCVEIIAERKKVETFEELKSNFVQLTKNFEITTSENTQLKNKIELLEKEKEKDKISNYKELEKEKIRLEKQNEILLSDNKKHLEKIDFLEKKYKEIRKKKED